MHLAAGTTGSAKRFKGPRNAEKVYQTEPLCTRDPVQAAYSMYLEHERPRALAAQGLVSATEHKALVAAADNDGVPVEEKLDGKRKATLPEATEVYRQVSTAWKTMAVAERARWGRQLEEAEASYLTAVEEYVGEPPPRVFGCRVLSKEHRIGLLPVGASRELGLGTSH